jgi:hypothetical protein
VADLRAKRSRRTNKRICRALRSSAFGARAFDKRPPTTFLFRPNRREDRATVLDEFWHGELVFLSILQVPWHTHFAANLRATRLRNANRRAERQRQNERFGFHRMSIPPNAGSLEE